MLAIRPLGTDDLGPVDDLLKAAFHAGANISFQPRLRRYLALQPDGWFVGEEAGQLVGTVGAIDYGAFAYVGLMAIRPERQGQRLGRRMLDSVLGWADRRGTTCTLLDASEAGAPLYERSGFVDVGLSHEFWPGEAGLVGGGAATGAPDGGTIAVATADDCDAIVQLDGALFGVRRERLWRWLFAAHPGRVLLARSGDGLPRGYVCAQDGLLGPFGARTPEIAEALLGRAILLLGHHARVRLQVPEANADARALLERRGFKIGRSLRHMRRGPFPALTGWTSLYGKGSYCLG
jgi:ribosomal protein S18 acetylase RimI-like enzyme